MSNLLNTFDINMLCLYPVKKRIMDEVLFIVTTALTCSALDIYLSTNLRYWIYHTNKSKRKRNIIVIQYDKPNVPSFIN